jgi:hypothetical protein
LQYFKIHGDLEEVAIMKSVPKWIFNLHKFSHIFYHFLSIFLGWDTKFGFITDSKISSRVGPTYHLLCRPALGPDWLAWVTLSCRHARGHKRPLGSNRGRLSEADRCSARGHLSERCAPPLPVCTMAPLVHHRLCSACDAELEPAIYHRLVSAASPSCSLVSIAAAHAFLRSCSGVHHDRTAMPPALSLR